MQTFFIDMGGAEAPLFFLLVLEWDLTRFHIRTYNINIKCGFDPRCRQYNTP